MANDKFYTKCCIASEHCYGKIEWHHNLIYAGRQVNEKWCILPVCRHHHDIEKVKEIGERLDYVMLNRGTDEEIVKFCKAIDYLAVKERLNKKYGKTT